MTGSWCHRSLGYCCQQSPAGAFFAFLGHAKLHGELLWDILDRLWAWPGCGSSALPLPSVSSRRAPAGPTPLGQAGILQSDETPCLDSYSGRENTLPVLSLGSHHLATLPAALVAFPFPALQGPAPLSFSHAWEGVPAVPCLLPSLLSSEALPGAVILLPADPSPFSPFLFLR